MINAFDDKMYYLRARQIGNILYEVPIKYSGLISSRALNALESGEYFRSNRKDLNTKGKIITKEHFHNRQKAGRVLSNLNDRNVLTEDLLIELIDCFSTVHYVLPEENTALVKIQTKCEINSKLSWKEQYSAAGINLVPDKLPKYKDIILLEPEDIVAKHVDSVSWSDII